MSFVERLFSLDGLTALVTGATGTLGHRFAQVLSMAGAQVILVGRDEKHLNEKASQVSKGQGVKTCVMDLSSPDSIQKSGTQLLKGLDKVDILINCAGTAQLTPVSGPLDVDTWDDQFGVNVRAPWILGHLVANHMISKGIRGNIVNVASVNGGAVPAMGASAYSASKGALIQLTRQMAGELAPYGIRVNAIVPGLFFSPMSEATIKSHYRDILQAIPLGVVGNSFDFDGALLMLASPKAGSYVTGTTLVVDGGVSLNMRSVAV